MKEEDILAGEWPDDLDIAVLPGVGANIRYDDAFSPRADDVRDALESGGVRVEFVGSDPNKIVLLESADWWGPVLFAGTKFLQDGGAKILSVLIQKAIEKIGGQPPNRAVLRIGRITSDEIEAEWLDYDGPAIDLPEAIRAWGEERRGRD